MVDRLKPDAVTLTYYVPIGNDDNTEDRVKVSIKTFSSGDTVEWLTWLKSFERLIRLKGWGQDGHTLILNARIVLRDMALDIFNAAAAEVEGATPQNFNTVMMQVAREFLVQDAREHLIDMIRNRRKTRDITVTEHLATMRQLSTLITTLPENDAPVSEKTLMYYFRKSMPLDWQTKYEESGREASTLTELARYFTRLEMNAERKDPRSQMQRETPRPSNPPKRKSSKETRKPAKHEKPAKPATGKWCSHHRTNTHSDEECHYQQKKRTAEFNYCELPDGDFEELNAVREIADPEDPREVVPAPKHKCETIIRLRGTGASRLFSALIDTGASRTLIDPAVLDREQLKRVHGHGSPFRLPQGAMKSRGDIAVKMQLTEFGENRRVQWSCAVADQLPYAMIIGRDLIQHLGFVLDFNAGEITWDGVTVPMRSISSQSTDTQIQTLLASSPSPPLSTIAQAEARQVEILDADYKKEPLDEQIPDYLSTDEQRDLLTLLEKFDKKLLSGTVGSWTGEPYDIPTVPNLVPYHAKPYPIAHSLLGLTKREVERLESLKIIARDESSPWASPAFVLPKANRTVRLLCDSRRLNKQLVRHPWPMPKITELFRSIPRFVFVTVLDLNMGYYAIHLTYRSSLLTAFILLFGKYRWLRLPMGISTAPDHFQARIDRLLGDLPFVRCYLDDVLIITETNFAGHLQQLEVVLRRLEDAGLTINVKKCKFAAKEANFLGYRLTTEGIAPQPEKVAAIQRLSAPSNKKELRRFIGLVNYYRDVWPQRAHLMAPLTRLTSQLVPWTWTAEHQAAFNKLKASMQRSTLLHYPDYDQPFEIFTDASSYQLGGIVSQAGKPLAFYSRKLTPAQKNYSVMEQELLSIVEILKEFRTMLFGQRITVYTDHKNLSCSNFSSGRVMRWRLIIEEFGPTIKYIKGADNTAADALSRLPQEGNDDAECNVLTEEMYPLNYSQIAQYQSEDETLQAAAVQYPRKFQTKTLGVHKVLLSKAGQVIIPSPLRTAVLDFYHTALLHPGMNRMYLTMSNSVYWPGMRRAVESYVRVCPTCQMWKRSPKQYGLIPEKIHGREPWSDIAVDEIGPYSYSDEPNAPKLYALTMIELTTNWIEIAPVKDQGAKTASLALDEFWFCRYPRPLRVIHDQGKEFVGKEFQEMLESYGVQSKPTTVKNPQANAVLERVHQVVGNMIRTTRLDQQQWTEILPSVAFAIRATVHTTLKASPAQLVFQRDMITDSLFTANWATIYSRRQRQTRRDNERENRSRYDHEYRIGTKVLVVKDIKNLPKLAQPTEGPYAVTAVHSNGTLTINRGRYEETINQRRVKPFFETDQA